jgi:hypothetical protein
MITRFAALTLSLAALTLSAPAAMALPTIYLVSGVFDDGRRPREGFATVFMCSNASGGPVDLRISVLDQNGNLRGEVSKQSLSHGRTVSITTHATTGYGGDGLTSPGWPILGGIALIEASSNAVFCSAIVVDASDDPSIFEPSVAWSLRLVRIDSRDPVPPGTGSAAAQAAKTLYVIPGIHDDGGRLTEGVSTTILCTNVSGAPVDIRIVILKEDGTPAGRPDIRNAVPHGKTVGVGSRRSVDSRLSADYAIDSEIGANLTPTVGSINLLISDGLGLVEATSTAVFCSAFITSPNSRIALNVERITPHPGAQE